MVPPVPAIRDGSRPPRPPRPPRMPDTDKPEEWEERMYATYPRRRPNSVGQEARHGPPHPPGYPAHSPRPD